jgi:hypothetical protein
MSVGGTGRGPFAMAGRRLAVGSVDEMRRRRSRQAARRPRTVQFSLSEGEFAELSEAAARSGLARGAFAAEAALATARGPQARVWSPLRAALAELMAAAGLVRRVGTNLNQAVARLNATGERARIWCLLWSSARG